MRCLISFYFCLLILLITCSKTAVEAFDMHNILNDIDEFNKTCPQDECQNPDSDSLSSWSCHCGQQCVQLGTCCAGSNYADVPQPKIKPACRTVYNGGTYFMVDDCPSGSALRSLCKEEWNKDNDLQRLVPVTSILSSITYKNYFCFRCHETHDDFLYWIVGIQRNLQQRKIFEEEDKNVGKNMSITYHKDIDKWMGKYDEDAFPVTVWIDSPSERMKLTHSCERNLISNCSDEWSDESVRIKCDSYMSIQEVWRNSLILKYKNMHCALCNFESLNDIFCGTAAGGLTGGGGGAFSFSSLIDVSGNERVGGRCPIDQIWDPFFGRCRNATRNENYEQ